MGFPQPFLFALLFIALIAAACTSASTEISGDTPAVTPNSDATTTSAEVTTTTEAATTTTQATTTTLPPVRAPLTGLVFEDDESELERPALLVKIDNDQKARPQIGLSEADMVIEMLVEGNITRFGAVFHSVLPDPVGPIRSSRTSDFDLLRGLNTPLYASSGGNAGTMTGLRNVSAVNVTNNRLTNPYFRDRSRRGPHNLFVPAPALYDYVTEAQEAPEPWFQYRADGDSVENQSQPQSGPVTITYSGRRWVTHEWDPVLRGWARTQDGSPHTDILGDQLAPPNVVIMVARYGTSRADASSPELISVGTGEAYVLTDGELVEGTWERADAEATPTLLDSNGDEILLTPGQTWVLYPKAGDTDLG